ncbi:MAG: DNA polymerase/3'-5' exonuclease PolX [bacterium]
MINLELSEIFYRIADFLELKEVQFKPRAYEKVARVLETMERDAHDIYKEGGLKALEEIPSVGKSIALQIEEYIKTGEIKGYNKLKKECPVKIEELLKIEGLGSRKIKVFYKKLNIKNLKDLEKAAKKNKIRELEGFGEKSEENILQGIELAKANKGRFLLGDILPILRGIVVDLKKLSEVEKITIAGSTRRMKETIGDGDILVVSSEPEKVMEYFTSMKEVVRLWAKGPTKSSARLKGGFDCDLRVVKKESFGAALQYFTGSKDHNIMTRRIAIKKRLKLNEYGVYSVRSGREKRIAGKTEKKVYESIGLRYIEPELRTNTGEIEVALENKLPKLIGYNDIKGDCQMHTTWSDGVNTIEEMVKTAKNMGYEYITITDHAGFLKIANAMGRNEILKQMKEIDEINKKLSGIKILKGCEVDIKKDGSLALDDEILSKLDFVGAAIHSNFKMNKEDMTGRLLRAIENPNVDAIFHPTGRIIMRREPFIFDYDKIFKAAKETKTILEIDAHPKRLDLKDTDVRQAIGHGVKLMIDTDAHSAVGLSMMEYGIGTARRGWAEKKDILNTRPLDKFLEWLER